ncbi:LIC12192 family sporadic carbohydrate cluster protein [Bradyrhizobium sp. LB13.1]
MAERAGHRGYIGARPLNGSRTPQHVQNIVIRDYARRKNLHYLLSAAEHTMQGSYMVMEDILDELPRLRGLILYSIFMLAARRGAAAGDLRPRAERRLRLARRRRGDHAVLARRHPGRRGHSARQQIRDHPVTMPRTG